MREDRKRINVAFGIETYQQIELIANKEGRSMSDVVREWTIQGLNGQLTASNIDILAPVIREQISSVLVPMMERMISLGAKTCVQAGTAAYLSAEAILKFVPPEERMEVAEAYDAARKKAVAAMKLKIDLTE